MARMSYLDFQMHERMQEMRCMGESRHMAKKEYREMKNEQNTNNRTVGIHSYATYSAYKQTSIEFIKYIRQNYKEIKDISKIKKEHVIDYIKIRQEHGQSPYTISKHMAALNKLLNMDVTKKEAGIHKRTYRNIKRSRGEKDHDKKYNPNNYREQIVFAKATGCRRESVLKVKVENFVLDKEGNPYKVFLKEKGGRERYATILNQYKQEIKEIIKNKEKGRPIFSTYTKKIDNHAFRAEYARKRYEELIKEKGKDDKNFRGFDSECLKILTRDLGHNRLDVVIYHYLR